MVLWFVILLWTHSNTTCWCNLFGNIGFRTRQNELMEARNREPSDRGLNNRFGFFFQIMRYSSFTRRLLDRLLINSHKVGKWGQHGATNPRNETWLYAAITNQTQTHVQGEFADLPRFVTVKWPQCHQTDKCVWKVAATLPYYAEARRQNKISFEL
jgi:hypothetical protein